jgi:hypothetical protein
MFTIISTSDRRAKGMVMPYLDRDIAIKTSIHDDAWEIYDERLDFVALAQDKRQASRIVEALKFAEKMV